MNRTFSIIGCGHIARVFLSALDSLDGKYAVPHSSVTLYNRTPEHISDLAEKGYRIAASAAEAFAAGNTVFLGVKPQDLRTAAAQLGESPREEKLLLSPIAGEELSLVVALTGCRRVVRLLPNTPISVGRGVTAVCRTDAVNDRDFEYVCRVFSLSGSVYAVAEKEMNAMCAATSSGVAFALRLLTAMSSAAQTAGAETPQLDRAIAETILGAAELCLRSGKTCEQLLNEIRSPNGTTHAAMNALDRQDFDGAVAAAVSACAARAAELGKNV